MYIKILSFGKIPKTMADVRSACAWVVCIMHVRLRHINVGLFPK